MFISLDLETTGFDPEKDKMIEFGAVKFDLNGHRETMQFLLNPERDIPEMVTHITGITDDEVANAPTFEEKKAEIEKFIGDLPIIGHNIQFDTNFLKSQGIPLTKNPEYDTLELSGLLLPNLASYSLEILSSIFELTHSEKHRALDDSIAAMELFLLLLDKFQELPKELIQKIHLLMEKTDWPLKNIVLKLKHKKNSSKKTAEKLAKIKNEIFKYTKSDHTLLQIPQKYYLPFSKQLLAESDQNTLVAVPDEIFGEIVKNPTTNFCTLDLPENYISPSRLKIFEEQEQYEDHEIRALIKYLIWIISTKTGLISEVTLFNKEKETITAVNANPLYTEISKEPFIIQATKKTGKAPALCTHQYLLQQNPEFNNLSIIDLESFTKTIYYNKSIFLSLKGAIEPLNKLKSIFPTNTVIETLISKITILFGMIGMILEKNCEPSEYRRQLRIFPSDLEIKQWKELSDITRNVIKLSKELGELKSKKETVQYALKSWKKVLESLFHIFEKPELENNMIFFEEDNFQAIIIKKNPTSLKNDLGEVLKNKKYTLVSEAIDLNDNGKFIKILFDLPEETPVINVGPKGQITLRLIDDNSYGNRIPDEILNYISEHQGITAYIANSKKQLTFLTLSLSRHFKKNAINKEIISQTTGSIGKLEEKLKNSKNAVLLLTPQALQKFDQAELIDTLIIEKIPFVPPSDTYLLSIGSAFSDSFNDFQVPIAAFTIKSCINKLSINKPVEVILLDNRLKTKDYGERILKTLEF